MIVEHKERDRIAKELYGGLYGDLVMLKNFISIYRMLKYNLWGYLTKNSTNKQIEKAVNAFNAGVNYDNQIT